MQRGTIRTEGGGGGRRRNPGASTRRLGRELGRLASGLVGGDEAGVKSQGAAMRLREDISPAHRSMASCQRRTGRRNRGTAGLLGGATVGSADGSA